MRSGGRSKSNKAVRMVSSYKRTRRRSSPRPKPQAGINAGHPRVATLLQRGEWAVASYRRRGIAFAKRRQDARMRAVANLRTFI
jgi:hypothetical protein